MRNKLINNGYAIFNEKIDDQWLTKIKDALPNIFESHENLRRKNNNPISSKGIAMNALVGNPLFFSFLQHLIDIGVIKWIEENYFKEKCIMNSFTALSNIPGEDKVFHKKIHRDIRGFSSDVPLLLNMLIMIDDFTIENGATLLLGKSHLKNEIPTDEYFKEHAIKATGKGGTIMIWNSNLFHASGFNSTDEVRRAIPITFSLPYYKQLLDYPRAIGYEKYDSFNPEMKRILGYDSRIPSTVSDWYSPIEKLLYKK